MNDAPETQFVNYFDQLPPELWLVVFLYLSDESLRNCELTSKDPRLGWYSLLRFSNYLWCGLIARDFSRTYFPNDDDEDGCLRDDVIPFFACCKARIEYYYLRLVQHHSVQSATSKFHGASWFAYSNKLMEDSHIVRAAVHGRRDGKCWASSSGWNSSRRGQKSPTSLFQLPRQTLPSGEIMQLVSRACDCDEDVVTVAGESYKPIPLKWELSEEERGSGYYRTFDPSLNVAFAAVRCSPRSLRVPRRYRRVVVAYLTSEAVLVTQMLSIREIEDGSKTVREMALGLIKCGY